MTLRNSLKDLGWAAPFLCIGLIVLALSRPPPLFPAPAQSRIVTDAAGVGVPITAPFRGVMLTWGAWGARGYLENTRAPQTLLNIGDARDRASFAKGVMNWIYPEVEKNDSLWDRDLLPRAHGRSAELETLLARDSGAYLGNGGDFGLVPSLRRLGLPAITLCWGPKNWDECIFSAARVETALIGQPKIGEALIARYRRAFADLVQDFQPETLTSFPRILIMGSYDGNRLYIKSERNDYRLYLPPAGVVNAAKGWTGEAPEAERILAMDPDIIFLMGSGQTPVEFEHDPRWMGLTAVRDKRVYTMPGTDPGGGGLAGLIFQPLWTRWMAELAHPDRLAPKLRELMRDTLLREFDYRLSDAQIDMLLRLAQNKNSSGYARFTKDYRARDGQKASQ